MGPMSATRIEPQPLALPAAWTPDQLPCGWLQFDDAGLLWANNRHFASALGRGGAALHGQALASCLSADSRLYFTTVILPCLRVQGRVDDATLVFSGDHGDWVVSACMHRDPGSARPLTTAILTPASARAAAAPALPSQAEVDPLTQLPNRTRLLQRLQEGIDAGSHLAVMFMDLDRFKQINDSLGHEAGDQLLQLVAQRLRHQLRSTDAALRLPEGLSPAPNEALDEAMAARLGGDEFVVVLDGLADDSAVQSVADRLIEALRQPYQVAGHEIVSEVSMGIVMGDVGSTPAQLLRDADTAMYEAKRNGRGRWAQFNAAMHERVATAMALEADLRDALRCHQVRVVFQPIVEIASGRITGMEALARWCHPVRGEVSPLVFIPIAEESGLIGELGERVLSLACQRFVAWQRAQVPLPQRLSVNLSRAQLQSRGLAARISSVLAQAGMPGSALQLEVTESLAMQNESVRSSMLALRELGIQLALDDFGTGHSSLAALNEFPVQQVKIDRSFVRQIETSAYHRALVQACLQVAQALSPPARALPTR